MPQKADKARVIKNVKRLVKKACKNETNYFGDSAWSHIVSVVKYAKLLAKKLDADEEIVEIAAWLHDYASVLDKKLYPEHHLHSSVLAEEILKKENFPQEKIERIKHCIFTHRASKKILRKTKEAKIVATADAMAHFDSVNALFHLAFTIHKLNMEKGTKWVLKKLKRSWEKLTPEAKQILQEKYKAIKAIFESIT